MRYQLVHAESGWAEGIPHDSSWACGGPLELPPAFQCGSIENIVHAGHSPQALALSAGHADAEEQTGPTRHRLVSLGAVQALSVVAHPIVPAFRV